MLQTDLIDVAPTSLTHLIGQRGVVDQVRVALDAAQQDNKPFDHALLVGPAGCGKTQTAKVIAAELGGDIREVIGQALESPADLNALLLGADDKDVILIDESASIPRAQQRALLIAVEQRKLILAGKMEKAPHSLPLRAFSLLLATTDEYKVVEPLRHRMGLILRFEFYNVEDLVEILRQRCSALGWPIERDVLPLIARRSRGIPRLALRHLQSARRVARSESEMSIIRGHFERACSLDGVDALGLGPDEKQYLRIVAKGARRLNVIVSRIGLPERTVSQVIEPFLIREGFVDKDEHGKRMLTAKGRSHLLES